MRNTVPASPGPAGQDKKKDDADFLSRWIAYGKSLKAKGDGYGIDWRGHSFEQYGAAISFAETWAMSEGVNEHA